MPDVSRSRRQAASHPGALTPSRPIRVAVDALGGDNAPDEIIAGAHAATTDLVHPVVYGPVGLDCGDLEHVVTEGAIAMDDKPADAIRARPDASLVRAVRAVGDGHVDAAISAGNTGATLAAAVLHVRRAPGVLRPAIAVVIPTRRGPAVLVDAGANADARPEQVVQFAHMGAVFAADVLGVPDPRVRLLSIGEEEEKGDQLTIDAHALLREAAGLRFEGNIEGNMLLEGGTDVVVAGGFAGNVALKTLEGSVRSLLEAITEEARSSLRGRVGGLLLRPALRELRTQLDPETHGGGYLLGLRGIVVVAHGSSSRRAISNAIHLAARGVEHDVVGHVARRVVSDR